MVKNIQEKSDQHLSDSVGSLLVYQCLTGPVASMNRRITLRLKSRLLLLRIEDKIAALSTVVAELLISYGRCRLAQYLVPDGAPYHARCPPACRGVAVMYICISNTTWLYASETRTVQREDSSGIFVIRIATKIIATL